MLKATKSSATDAGAYQPLAAQLTTQLSSRGQIVIPKALRDAHAWGQNTVFVVRDHPEGLLLTPAPAAAAKLLGQDALIGCVQTPVRLATQALTEPVSDYGDGMTGQQW